MLDRLQIQAHSPRLPDAHPAAPGKKVLRMVTNDRMAGSIPKWEDAASPAEEIASNLSSAQSASPSSFQAALAYQGQNAEPVSAKSEFGFGDLLDMINPLQHIPVVGSLYRELTGDEIKPISRIIGGGVFGGGIGAAAGLVNVIVEEETGEDLTGNAYNLVSGREKIKFKNRNASPEQRLDQALNNAGAQDLPGTLLAFADLRSDPAITIERVKKD